MLCAATSRDHTVALWDCGTSANLHAWDLGDGCAINGCALLSDSTALPPRAPRVGATADTAGGGEDDELDVHEREVGTEGKALAVAVEDGSLQLIDLRRRPIAMRLDTGGSPANCCCVLRGSAAGAASHGALLAAGTDRGVSLLWDIRSSRFVVHAPRVLRVCPCVRGRVRRLSTGLLAFAAARADTSLAPHMLA